MTHGGQGDPTPSVTDAPIGLVVVGAAVGMGRWLVDHVLSTARWDGVTLVDLADRSGELALAAQSFAAHQVSLVGLNGNGTEPPTSPGARPAGRTLLVVAVPPGELADVATRVASFAPAGSTVAVVADQLVDPLRQVAELLPGRAVAGVHPLFERTAPALDGQIVYLVPPDGSDPTYASLVAVIGEAGGVVKVGTAAQHDRSMKYVQAAAHQTLLNFVDVLARSGLDLDEDLWSARTPLFEALFGLAARVLDPRHRTAIERIEATQGARDVAAELLASASATQHSIASPEVTAERLDEISEHVGGSLFTTARHVAEVAVAATRSTRAELSRRRADHDLVGVRLVRRPDVLHVGRILEIGSSQVVIDDLLIPGSGRGAVLATGPGLVNGKRVGARGNARKVSLNIGQISLLSGADLDRELDARLAFLRRDVRFLVPESVSGRGVLRALQGTAGTRAHELVSEVVRTGQRAVVVRLEIRADRDLDDTVEQLRAGVQRIYAWPDGICRPARPRIRRIAYLGPPGTFSATAAQQCARAAGLEAPALLPQESFADIVGLLATGDALAVLPISSSSSGLVTRACTALWDAGPTVTVGGIVDVSVRIDAYIPTDSGLEQLRGSRVYSHPQAIAQSSQFIRRWGLHPVACASTTEALQRVGSSSESAVALAAAESDLAGLALKVGEREVDDLSGSITRFLIVGPADGFGQFSDEHTPTTRTVLLGRTAAPGAPLLGSGPAASYDEVLADAEGNYLLVTSRAEVPTGSGLRRLGTSPWSPRTPLVRVAAP